MRRGTVLLLGAALACAKAEPPPPPPGFGDGDVPPPPQATASDRPAATPASFHVCICLTTIFPLITIRVRRRQGALKRTSARC